MSDVKTGSVVRSFDFPDFRRDVAGVETFYFEGVVEGVDTDNFDCPRYKIKVNRRVWEGREVAFDEYVFPPVNGTPTWFDSVTDGVEVIN